MASRRQSSGRRSRSSSSPATGVRSRFNSWFAIATTLLGLTGSYFGCKPNIGGLESNPANSANQSAYPDYNSSSPNLSSVSTNHSASQSPISGSGSPNSSQAATETSTAAQTTVQPTGLERDSILIGSFNIQTFGRTKMSRPGVVEILVDVARRFDILAIQELRDSQEGTIPEFLRLINANGSRYLAAVSPIISYGQGTHSEQLVYIYDSDQIELLHTPYVATDRQRVMFRPPYIGHFRYRSRYPQDAFSFVLMNVHTSPQQTAAEFTALEEIVAGVVQTHANEDDFVLLGDLNEEPGRYLPYRWLNNQYAAIPSHWKTNTAETKNYDNFVFDFRRTSEFTGQSGILNLKDSYQLSREQADLVSDHMPVWALFSSREVAANNLVQQPAMIR